MGELGINLPSLIAQIINFGILFGLLYLVAYKPVMKMLDERSRKIKESLEQSDQIKQQAAQAEIEVKKQLEAARREGQEIITRTIHTSEELRQKAIEDAKKEGEAIIIRARGEIQRERDEAVDEVRKQFGDLAILAAEKVIDRSLDKKAHLDLIERTLEESVRKSIN